MEIINDMLYCIQHDAARCGDTHESNLCIVTHGLHWSVLKGILHLIATVQLDILANLCSAFG